MRSLSGFLSWYFLSYCGMGYFSFVSTYRGQNYSNCDRGTKLLPTMVCCITLNPFQLWYNSVNKDHDFPDMVLISKFAGIITFLGFHRNLCWKYIITYQKYLHVWEVMVLSNDFMCFPCLESIVMSLEGKQYMSLQKCHKVCPEDGTILSSQHVSIT